MMTLNHGFSGYVCAQLAMPLLKKSAPFSERALGLALFLGTMMPDLDILSRPLGRIPYFSYQWFAHRQLSHSLPGTLLLALIFSGLYWHFFGKEKGLRGFLWLTGILWAGGGLHILGDLFTPGMAMPIFWPLDFRVGSLAHIGWFSPYIWWLFVSTIALAWAFTWLNHIWQIGSADTVQTALQTTRKTFAVWSPKLIWVLYAVSTGRWIQFLLSSRYESRSQWTEFHQDLLPQALIEPLIQGVRYIWNLLIS